MIRFKNGKVLTLDGGCTVEDSEVWTDGDKISFVGTPTDEQLKDTVFDREIDLDGDLLMPSFKNAHTHSAMTFLRSYADDLPLQEWLFNRVFPMEAKLTGRDVYWFTKLAILEYLTSGVTASFDMYFELDDYVKANLESGFRSVMCDAVSGERDRAAEVEQRYLKYNGIDPLISFRLGFHAEYTATYGLIEEIGALAEKYKAPVCTHNSETAREVNECIERYGMTPNKLFDTLGLYKYGGTQFHCVHLTNEDMGILARRGVYAVSCPASNLKLASGIAPITDMLAKGVQVGLGTDGPASNNALDMFREMYLMSVLQKYRNDDAASLPADEVLKAACSVSAKAMGLDNCDCIAVGKQADLTVIDLKQPNMQPLHNIPKNIVYSGSKQNVKLTMCAGKVLYENGSFFIGEDTKRIYAKCNEHCRKLEARD
ncbi:MAG: amidohydrolase [Ruminococcus sp.]|nr:amidohydrolase [Ruminococcus sp.]